MCDHGDNSGSPLTFTQFLDLLKQPPFEPCASELQFLTPVEYEAAFAEAARLFYHKVRRHIARITENPDSAADLTQEVFIGLYRARTSFDPPYIYRSAKNAAYKELRRCGRQRRFLSKLRVGGTWEDRRQDPHEFDLPDPRPLPDAELFEKVREEALVRALERLPAKFRVPLALYVEGNSYKQIMRITRTKKGTVESRICWAKSILRRRLRDYL